MADIFNFYVYDDRSIRYELAEPIMLEDKDVTQFRFRIPKVLNNIDMSSWEWWFIFVNAKKVKYTSQLVLTDDEDDPENFSVATYTVGYGFSGYVGTVSFSIEALNVSGEDIVNEWHTKTYTTHVLDTLQGTRAVIPEPEADAGKGLTAEEKSLILELFSKAAYAEDDASTAYDRLEALWTIITRLVSLNLSHVTSSNQSASVEGGSRYTTTLTADTNYTLNSVSVTMGGVDITSTAYSSGTITIPSVTGNIVITATAVLAAQSITATYTQSGTVCDTDSLDSLKADLVVTANYAGGTSETVPASNYTLSGTLTVGTSTVTVNYAGLTDTFSVTVSAAPIDTTAQLDTTHMDKGQGNTVGNYTSKTGFCPTILYDLGTLTGVTYDYAKGIIPVDATGSNTCRAWAYTAEDVGSALSAYGTGKPMQVYSDSMTEGQFGLSISQNYVKMAIPVHVDYLADSYLYIESSGKVLFAGRNTPYYGMQNISEASS